MAVCVCIELAMQMFARTLGCVSMCAYSLLGVVEMLVVWASGSVSGRFCIHGYTRVGQPEPRIGTSTRQAINLYGYLSEKENA